MDYYETLFSAVFNIFSMYVNVRVIKLFLSRKKEKVGVALPIYFIAWILNWLVYYKLQVFILTTLSLLCGLILIVCVLYDGNVWKKIVAVVASMALTLVAEEIVWRILNIIGIGVENEAVGCLWSTLLALGIILIIEKQVYFDKEIQLPISSYFSLFFMAFGNIILTYLFMGAEITNQSAMIGLTVICLVNVSIYSLQEIAIESYREKIQAMAMRQQVKMYANQFEIISQSQQNIKSLRHDIKNHLLKINSYLQNQKCEEAIGYIKQMESALEVPKEYIRTGNLEIDGIMNYKLAIIKDLGCVPVIEIDVPEQRFMSDFDLTVILGNLLDNAIEALQKVEKKILNIRIRYAKGVLYIGMYNSFNGVVNKEGTNFLSIKKDKKDHGIGLSNIESIVSKYDGEMKIDCDKGIYGIDIILYTK